MTSRRKCGEFWSGRNVRVPRVVMHQAGDCREKERGDAQGVGRGGREGGGAVVAVVWDMHRVASCLLEGGF